MTFLDQIRITYSDTLLRAKDGTLVDPFYLENVENTLPTVHVIPGKIEAEEYESMDGISLENTTDVGGGQNIGYLDAGDYLWYEAKVLNSANYSVDFRHASQSNGAVQFSLHDTARNLITTFPIANLASTGGWQSWTTTDVNAGMISSGDYLLKLNVLQAPVNINWYEFIQGVHIEEEQELAPMLLYPNPTRNGFHIKGQWPENSPMQVFVYDESGRLWLRQELLHTQDALVSTEELNPGTYYVTVSIPGRRFTEKLVVQF